MEAILDDKGRPVSSGAIVARPAVIDVGRLDLLDPEMPDERMIRALEQRALFRSKVVEMALKQTSPSQYVIHKAEGDDTRESVYPMGAAADAMFGFLGLTWAVPIEVEEVDPHTGQKTTRFKRGPVKWSTETKTDAKEHRYFWVRSGLWSRDALVALAEGKRLIGSGYAKNEPDAELDAFENLKSRACREVLGLKGKDRAWYHAQGLDLSRARVAEFQDRKSVTSADPTEATVPFGTETKGKKVCDIDDRQLEWVLGMVEKSLADPKKERWKKENEALRDAVKAEQAKRAAAPTISAAEREEFEKTILAIREEAAVQKVNPDKFDKYIAQIDTLAKAKEGLAFYRDKRNKAEAKAKDQKAGG